jgi:uncharacterized protein YgiM (DUF1202 family)
LVIFGVMVLVLILAGLFFVFYTLVLKKDGESPIAEVTPTTVQIVETATKTVAPPKDTATSEPAVSKPAASTTTPIIPPTVPPTKLPQPTLTLRPPPEVITIGVRASVNISEGLGLNLRDLPTLNGSTVITALASGSQVDVLDGPEVAGDLRWWNVNGSEGQVGWVVDAFGGEVWLLPVGWSDQLTPLPTPEPTATSTLTPTVEATLAPTVEPTLAPTVESTLTPTAVPPTEEPEATPEGTPTATLVLTPTTTPEGGVPSPTVGGRAQVATRYQFVNLRAEPGLDAETITQLQDGTVVTVLEGPEEADRLSWWKVDDGQGNVGWAAERTGQEVLLVPIQ